MKKLFCTFIVLLLTTFQLYAVHVKSSDHDSELVEQLIKRARNGDTEALLNLSRCYKEGCGVKQSDLNSIMMYYVYTESTDKDFGDYVSSLGENDPFIILTNILDKHYSVDYVMEKASLLRDSRPGDARMLDAVCIVTTQEKPDNVLVEKILKEAEEKGSELSSLLLCIFYDKINSDKCTEYIIKRASTYPILYNIASSKMYAKYVREGKKDFTLLCKSAECLMQADAYGALLPEKASRLLDMIAEHGDKVLKCTKADLKRLTKIAHNGKTI